MRYAIISDCHANLEATLAVLEHIDKVGADLIINLGDIVGYNANPNECCDIMRERGIPTICGNHDAVACGLEEPWGFNPVALSAAMWTRDNLRKDNIEWLRNLPETLIYESFMAVHGAPGDRNHYLFSHEDVAPLVPALEREGIKLCFFGHTHQPGIFAADGAYALDKKGQFVLGKNKTYFINPGSVGQPRDGDLRAAFGFFDSETNTFEQVRLTYPVHESADKVANNGLPAYLSERLLLGR